MSENIGGHFLNKIKSAIYGRRIYSLGPSLHDNESLFLSRSIMAFDNAIAMNKFGLLARNFADIFGVFYV